MAQGKLVRVVAGSVFDVAVDIRGGSPTYGRWVGAVLDDEHHRMLWVPPGFLHGFVTLSDTVHLSYKCTNEYSPAHDRGVRWDDPAIGIDWPVDDPLLSPKDRAQPLLADAENTFVFSP
jgi:dTDP-4-dehydrorhamnose 3,5-epimerase